MAGIVGNLRTFDDYKRAEEEFRMKKAAQQAEIEASRFKMQNPTVGQPIPAAKQLADEYIKNMELAAKAATPEEKQVYLNRTNVLDKFAETVDRGVINSPDGGYMSAPGYDQLLAQRKGLSSGADEQAAANVKINTSAEIERQKKLGQGEIPEIDKQAKGKVQFSTIADEMRNDYQKLNDMGALISNKRPIMDNISAAARASGLGQVIGRMTGSQEQTYRDQIKNNIPRIMSSIINASGMSAKQVDSIPEMKLLKESVTDPKQSMETINSTLGRLVTLYGNSTERVPAVGKVYPAEAAAAKLDNIVPKFNPSKDVASIPAKAAKALKENPDLAAEFDAKYKQGASKFVLGN